MQNLFKSNYFVSYSNIKIINKINNDNTDIEKNNNDKINTINKKIVRSYNPSINIQNELKNIQYKALILLIFGTERIKLPFFTRVFLR